MSKRTKTTILIASFLAFFVLSWLIVLYAFGYYFDLKSFDWIKTGGFLVKAGSSDVRVFINDRFKGKTSFLSATFVEKNLLPGSYGVRLEKDGFQPLDKNVEIRSGEAAQLLHIYLAGKEEVENFIMSADRDSEAKPEELPYFISGIDGLLYKKLDDQETEKISSEPVYITDFILKALDNNIYIASYDSEAPGVFLLDSEGKWEQIHQAPTDDLAISPDRKKLAIIGSNEISVLWLKDENEFPYFKKDHKEPVSRIAEKIEKVYWFKTDWHLIYRTAGGETYFVEVDPTGGRNNVRL